MALAGYGYDRQGWGHLSEFHGMDSANSTGAVKITDRARDPIIDCF